MKDCIRLKFVINRHMALQASSSSSTSSSSSSAWFNHWHHWEQCAASFSLLWHPPASSPCWSPSWYVQPADPLDPVVALEPFSVGIRASSVICEQCLWSVIFSMSCALLCSSLSILSLRETHHPSYQMYLKPSLTAAPGLFAWPRSHLHRSWVFFSMLCTPVWVMSLM